MLVSTAGAARFGDVILKTDSSTGIVINQYNYNNNSCDKCPAPALKEDSDKGAYLTIDKHVDPETNVSNYKVTNSGDVPLKGVEVMGQHVAHHTLAPGESVEFDTLSPLRSVGKI